MPEKLTQQVSMRPEPPQLVPSDPVDEPHYKQLFEVVYASDQVPSPTTPR